jgi:hypothetical protein
MIIVLAVAENVAERCNSEDTSAVESLAMTPNFCIQNWPTRQRMYLPSVRLCGIETNLI